MKTPSSIIHKGMCIAVMGLGITGRAAVRYCVDRGARVIVSDSRAKASFVQEDSVFLSDYGIVWEAGRHTVQFLKEADLVIISPGIRDDHKVVNELRAAGIPVVGELAIAAPHLDVPVVAVTGTNGKTTVTSVIGEICKAAGNEVFVGGNIGTPLFDFLRKGQKADVIVLEVSSFQLQAAGEFSPNVGVLLNITPDHLDWHGDFDRYARAKENMFKHQKNEDSAILCRDDQACVNLMDNIASKVSTFGADIQSDAKIVGSRIGVTWNGKELVYDLADTHLDNAIGRLNSGAAILAAHALGIESDTIQRTLRTFEQGPHRMQIVGTFDGVTYVNDSKATNTGAVIAALGQLEEGKGILIAGGRDKGENYGLLAESVKQKAREVILIGEAAADIRTALNGSVTIHSADTMEDAVQLAESLAHKGDTVLLSPACASFDMFRTYGHRGDVFTTAVKRLIAKKLGAGESENG